MTNLQKIQPIFIFSLPRSGSTLLQRLLATSDDIATTSEPWILLPFIYPLKSEGTYTEYSHFITHAALKDLCQQLPNKDLDYLDAVKIATLNIYTKLTSENEKYFLDKTPRYALICETILQMFPEGKFIFLWRNPLAVVASMIETFNAGKWKIFHSKIDLYDGLQNLIETYEKNRNRVLGINFEQLIDSPDQQLDKISTYLEIRFSASTAEQFTAVTLNGNMGDPTGQKDYCTINSKPKEKWKNNLTSPWRKYWCRKYINWIGEDRLAIMGYNNELLLTDLSTLPVKWKTFFSDIFYSGYGIVYSMFEFKILKDKVKLTYKNKTLKKHS